MKFKPICSTPDDIPPAYYRHPALDGVTEAPGVYILKCGGQYYIGSSNNLRLRLMQHARANPLQLFAVKYTEDFRSLEYRAIKQAKKCGVPLANIHYMKDRIPPKPKAPKKPKPPKKGKRVHYKRWITINGRCRPMAFWCRQVDISIELALVRIHSGWPEREAVTTPRKYDRRRTRSAK